MPSHSPSLIDRLLAALKADLVRPRELDATISLEIAAILENWPRPFPIAERPAPHPLPACRYLAQALTAAAAGPAAAIAEAIGPFTDHLHWTYGYPALPRWPDLASRVGFAQLIGPTGTMDDDRLHIGLTLMAPGTHYPMHAHPAIETYLVLSGAALWRISGFPFTLRPAGDLILHASGIGHAMETTDAPLLALFIWRGDLVTAPTYIEDDA